MSAMLNKTTSSVPKFRGRLNILLLTTLIFSGNALARDAAVRNISPEAASLSQPSIGESPESVVRISPNTAVRDRATTFGQDMVTTASSLTFALTDGVKSTVLGTASLAGTVTGAVTSTLRNTVTGTANVAGALGSAVGGAVKSTVIGTYQVAGTVTGIVTDTVRHTVSGTVNVAGAVAGGVGSTVSGVAKTLVDAPQRMIQYATTMLGTPYKWGGNTVDSGLDCSGFVREVVQSTTGTLLPRTAREMSHQGTQVAYTEMKPGDLVFFNTRRRPFSHVGIYLGDGRFMHGASGKKSGKQVRIDSFNSTYYRTRFNGARRIADTDQIASGTEVISSTAVGIRPTINCPGVQRCKNGDTASPFLHTVV